MTEVFVEQPGSANQSLSNHIQQQKLTTEVCPNKGKVGQADFQKVQAEADILDWVPVLCDLQKEIPTRDYDTFGLQQPLGGIYKLFVVYSIIAFSFSAVHSRLRL